MSGERYHPNLGSATLIIAAITLFFTLINAIFGPWPGHFSEKMYGLPLLMGLLGIETSQPIWGPAGVFSFQEVLLLLVAAICGGVSYWARRLRPEYSVPEGMTLADFGERQFTDTQVVSSGPGKEGGSMTLSSAPISLSPLSSDLLSDLDTPAKATSATTTAVTTSPASPSPSQNPTTAAIVDNIIGDTPAVSASKIEESFSNLGATVAQSAPISGVREVREFAGESTVVNVPLPGAAATPESDRPEATALPEAPEAPVVPESPSAPTTSELPEVHEVPALPEAPEVPESPPLTPRAEVVAPASGIELPPVPLPPSPIAAELEELESFPDLKLDLPELPDFNKAPK